METILGIMIIIMALLLAFNAYLHGKEVAQKECGCEKCIKELISN